MSRHAKSMYRQEIDDAPEGFNAILGFRVDFFQFPPDISFIYQPYEYVSEDACNESKAKYRGAHRGIVMDESEAKYRGACRRIVMNGEHRGGVFIEIRVPIGTDRYETLMCMGDAEKPNCYGSTSSGQPSKVAEILQRGKAAGGRPRRVCTGSRGPLKDPLEAEYDELDKLVRRLKLASMQAGQLFDEDLIDSVVDQYLIDLGVHDSTPGRYS